MSRASLVLLLFLALVAAGCGGEDGGGAATGGDDDPAVAIPSDAPLSVRFATDLDGEAWDDNFAFANAVDPADRDLKQMLIAELDSDADVKYTRDVKPWLGDEAVFFLADYDEPTGEATGAVVARVTDEDAARKFVESKVDGGRKASYSGTDYMISDDDSAAGLVDGFLVAASDEAQFKASVDAAGGASLADQDRFREAMDDVPDDAAATVYADVDRTLELLSSTNAVPAQTLDLVKNAPGFKAGQAATVSVVPDEDAMTVEAAGPASGADPADGPSVEDLAGEAWFAAAGSLQGEQFASGLQQGLASGGGAQATQLFEQLGVQDFLKQLEGFSARFGGTGIFALNGEVTLQGSDPAAASRLLDGAASQLQAAGAPVQRTGNGLKVNVPPYAVEATADGGDVRIRLGDAPESKLGDGEAFKDAKDELDLDRVSAFVDFAGLEKLLRGIPNASADPNFQQVLAVLPKLGALAAGSEVDGDRARSRLVLTLRDGD